MKYIPKRILQTTLLASGLFLLNACGGGGGSTADTNTSTPDATSITHNGTTYGFVTSPHTGKVWLDRNLGAARVCEQLDDSACYGDYYQWGRNWDGHQDSGSTSVVGQSADVNNAGTNFLTASQDWASVDSNGNTRITNWSKTDGSSVCPVGFKVPSIEELRAETLENDVTDRDTAFTNFLALPSAGYRNFSGSMTVVGLLGTVWASSVTNGPNSHNVNFRSGTADNHSANRRNGYSVRCLRD